MRVLTILAIICSGLTMQGTAVALNYDRFCTQTLGIRNFDIKFEGPDWNIVVNNRTRQSWAMEGIQQWNGVTDYTTGNSGVVQIVAYPGVASQTIHLFLDPAPGGSTGYDGYARCNTAYGFQVDIKTSLSGTGLRHVAGHEMGHILDQRHTFDLADQDSSAYPIMRTCRFTDDYLVSQDDTAGLYSKKDPVANASYTANPGFESPSGLSRWGYKSGMSTLFVGPGAYNGGAYMSYLPSSASDSMYSSTAVTQAAGNGLNARGMFKAAAAGLAGNITLQYQTAAYSTPTGTGTCSPSNFDGGFNENLLTAPGLFYVRHSTVISPSATTWTLADTNQWSSPVDQEYIASRVRVVSTLNNPSTGQLRGFYADNVRVRKY